MMSSFPNNLNKYDEASIFEPLDFFNYLKAMGRVSDRVPPQGVIFCYDRYLFQYIAKTHPHERESVLTSDLLYLSETDHTIAVAGQFGIGAPAAAALLEYLIAFGVKNFISIGTAGCLQKDLAIGDLVVCDRAIRDEGLSHHYIPSAKFSFSSELLTQKMIQTLTQLNQSFQVGTSWTIDTPYRETHLEAAQYQAEGVLTVEMEAAALFAVATYRNVDLASLLTISDSLAELKWSPHFYHERTTQGLETIFQIAKKSLAV